jgi:hypothetical protein
MLSANVCLNTLAYGFFNHFYLPFPLTINYVCYNITSGGGNSEHVRICLYDTNGGMKYDSGNQSASKAEYRIPVSSLTLVPGIYYYIIKTSNAGTKFLGTSNYTNNNAIPRKGLYYLGSYSTAQNNIDFSKVSLNGIGQPWLGLSQY